MSGNDLFSASLAYAFQIGCNLSGPNGTLKANAVRRIFVERIATAIGCLGVVRRQKHLLMVIGDVDAKPAYHVESSPVEVKLSCCSD